MKSIEINNYIAANEIAVTNNTLKLVELLLDMTDTERTQAITYLKSVINE